MNGWRTSFGIESRGERQAFLLSSAWTDGFLVPGRWAQSSPDIPWREPLKPREKAIAAAAGISGDARVDNAR